MLSLTWSQWHNNIDWFSWQSIVSTTGAFTLKCFLSSWIFFFLFLLKWKIQLHKDRDNKFSRTFYTITQVRRDFFLSFFQFLVTNWWFFNYLIKGKLIFVQLHNTRRRPPSEPCSERKKEKSELNLAHQENKRKLRRQREKSQNTSRSTEPICDTK